MSVILFADRSYVYQYRRNIGIPYLLLPSWVEFVGGIGIVCSGNVVSNRY